MWNRVGNSKYVVVFYPLFPGHDLAYAQSAVWHLPHDGTLFWQMTRFVLLIELHELQIGLLNLCVEELIAIKKLTPLKF